MSELDPEDAKLVTLAKATLARSAGATEGAAVRDEIGRTYAAASVSLGDLDLSALEVAAVMASSSGVQALAAAALVSADGHEPDERTRAVLAAIGDPAVHVTAG